MRAHTQKMYSRRYHIELVENQVEFECRLSLNLNNQ